MQYTTINKNPPIPHYYYYQKRDTIAKHCDIFIYTPFTDKHIHTCTISKPITQDYKYNNCIDSKELYIPNFTSINTKRTNLTILHNITTYLNETNLFKQLVFFVRMTVICLTYKVPFYTTIKN